MSVSRVGPVVAQRIVEMHLMVAGIVQLLCMFVFGVMDVIVLIIVTVEVPEIFAIMLVMDRLLMMMMVMMAGAMVVGMWVKIVTATAVEMAAIGGHGISSV